MDIDGRFPNWMMALLPYSVAVGPLGTLVTLEVVSLRGGAIDVGYAMSAGSAAGVLGPLLWGYLLDKYGNRRILPMGFLGTGLFIALLMYAVNIPEATLYYAAASLFSSAVGMSVSVLLIGSSSKHMWNESYSSLNLVSSLGYLIGDVAAAALSGLLSLRMIMLLMGLLSMMSAAMSIAWMPAGATGRPRQVGNAAPSDGVYDIRTNEFIMLYLALVIFYLSSGIFNTLYPYGLRTGGLSKSWVMAIISTGMGIQILGYLMAPRIIRRFNGNVSASTYALIIRGSSYMAIGMSSTAPESMIMSGLTLYPLAAGMAFATFYTASNVIIFETLRRGNEGKGLGVYNTVTGTAYLGGSLASGYLADFMGIGRSYLVAGALLFASAYLFKIVGKAKARHGAIEATKGVKPGDSAQN